MFDTLQPVPGAEPNWLDGVDLPGPDEWGHDPFERRCRCLSCGHQWEERLPLGQFPCACPDCKSPWWFRPPKQKGRTLVLLKTPTEQLKNAIDAASDPLDWILTASPKAFTAGASPP